MFARIAVAVEVILLAAASVFLVTQAIGIWPRVALTKQAQKLKEVRGAGSAQKTALAVAKLIRTRPRDASLRLIYARSLLLMGQFDKAAVEYGKASKVARKSGFKAAAEIGRGTALLLKSTPPSAEDLAAARSAAAQARKISRRLPDARALLAVVHLWDGKPDLAKSEAEAVGKALPGLEAAAALHCVRGYLAASGGDAEQAHAEFVRAGMLMPADESPLGAYVAGSIKTLRLEAASQAMRGPDAPPELREALVKHLESEGAEGIAKPESFPLFLRAAVSCALMSTPKEREMGMRLLARAAAVRGDDMLPYLARAAVVAERLAPLFQTASEFVASLGPAAVPAQSVSLMDLLPGGARTRTGTRQAPVNVHLKAIEDGGSAALCKDLERAAKLLVAAGDARSSERAFDILEYRFRWLMRMAQLSTDPGLRRKREREAAAAALAAREILGDKTPRNQRAAVLMRNAGVFSARRFALAEACDSFQRSIALFPDQPELRAYLKEMSGLKVAALYPSTRVRLRPESPLLGAEFSLSPGVKDLGSCEVTATIGPKDGKGKQITPVISGTGVWYVPKADELPDGELVARFKVKDPMSKEATAEIFFAFDRTPPKITSLRPDRDAVISDRQTLIRIGWRDPSGLELESIEVILEPVAAAIVRRALVSKGRQKSGRYGGKVKWKRNDPVVSADAGGSGEIVTGPMTELPKGSYRVRVSMRDTFDHLTEDSWQFRIR